MGVFQAEAAEVDRGVGVGDVVAVGVGIEEEIGWVEDPDPSPPNQDRRDDIQACDDILCFVIGSIAVGIFEHADFVGAGEMVGRWGGLCRRPHGDTGRT